MISGVEFRVVYPTTHVRVIVVTIGSTGTPVVFLVESIDAYGVVWDVVVDFSRVRQSEVVISAVADIGVISVKV